MWEVVGNMRKTTTVKGSCLATAASRESDQGYNEQGYSCNEQVESSIRCIKLGMIADMYVRTSVGRQVGRYKVKQEACKIQACLTMWLAATDDH